MEPDIISAESEVEYGTKEETDLDTSEADSASSAEIASLKRQRVFAAREEIDMNEKLKHSIDALQKEIAMKEAHVTSLRDDCEMLQNYINELSTKIAALEQYCDQTQREVELLADNQQQRQQLFILDVAHTDLPHNFQPHIMPDHTASMSGLIDEAAREDAITIPLPGDVQSLCTPNSGKQPPRQTLSSPSHQSSNNHRRISS